MGERDVDTVVIGKSKILSLRKRVFAYRRAGPQEFDLLFDGASVAKCLEQSGLPSGF